jgi:hypothetical protein
MTLDNNISSNSLRRERRQFRAKELQSNAYASFRPLAFLTQGVDFMAFLYRAATSGCPRKWTGVTGSDKKERKITSCAEGAMRECL